MPPLYSLTKYGKPGWSKVSDFVGLNNLLIYEINAVKEEGLKLTDRFISA
jgi:hypothetical protein